MSDRRLEYRPIKSIKGAARNPKHHAEADIAASVGRFGFVEPMILDERTGKLVAGHGRLADLRRREKANEEPPDGIQVVGGKWLAPIIVGWSSRSDEEAERYLLASNQITIEGGWEADKLLELLAGIGTSADDLLGTGFSEEAVAALMHAGDLGRALSDLTGMVEGGKPDEVDPDAGGPRLMTADQIAKLSFSMTHEDRDYIVTKLRVLQRKYAVDSTAAALRRLVDEVEV